MKVRLRWVALETVLATHEQLIREHGGLRGIRDPGALESALARPKNVLGYRRMDLFSVAASYIEGIVRNHPFVDGNKRTGFIVGYIFLRDNGYRLKVEETSAVCFMVGLADRSISIARFEQWLRKSCTRERHGRRPSSE